MVRTVLPPGGSSLRTLSHPPVFTSVESVTKPGSFEHPRSVSPGSITTVGAIMGLTAKGSTSGVPGSTSLITGTDFTEGMEWPTPGTDESHNGTNAIRVSTGSPLSL